MGNELSYEYGGGYGGDSVDRNNWADVSQAALRREKQAEAVFATVKTDWESKVDDLPAWSKHFIPLLDPSQHLVATVWTRFRRHVKNANNNIVGGHQWDVKRRVANAEERKAYRITRQSKAYFVDAVFTVGAEGSSKCNNQKAGEVAAAVAPAAATSATTPATAALSLDVKKRAAASNHPPGLVLSTTSTNSNLSGAAVSVDQLSKKPRRLQDLSNHSSSAVVVSGGAAASSSGTVNTKKKPAPPVLQPLPRPVNVSSYGAALPHAFKYGDIVGIFNDDRRRPPTLAMFVYFVDPYTARVSYPPPNRHDASVPIHQVQLLHRVSLPPLSTMMTVVAGGHSNNTSNNKNVATSTQEN
jgi:hypothetical protein